MSLGKNTGGAPPHRFRPMYAEANMGHPSNSESFVVPRNGPEKAEEMDVLVEAGWLREGRGTGRVPQVRLSVPGPKTMGRSPSNAFTR